MHAKAHTPTTAAKIAASMRGKPRPPDVVKGMQKRMLGNRLCKATRAKMSDTHKRRGTRPPWLNSAWAPWEDELLAILSPEEAAKQTGRTLAAVLVRRSRLDLPDGRTRRERRKAGRSK
jgi:hypothetical protein